jgi:hypothetical protein
MHNGRNISCKTITRSALDGRASVNQRWGERDFFHSVVGKSNYISISGSGTHTPAGFVAACLQHAARSRAPQERDEKGGNYAAQSTNNTTTSIRSAFN